MDLATQQTALVYSSSEEIHGSALSLDSSGEVLSFAQKIGGTGDGQLEICTVKTDGTGFLRLTNDAVMDVYPAWSPDGSHLAFLSMRAPTLQLFQIGFDGSDEHLLYDPGVGSTRATRAGSATPSCSPKDLPSDPLRRNRQSRYHARLLPA